VTLTPNGHVVVLGTAGSGKTTMAIHRAAYVADERGDHGGRTLLVTFNRALVTYLEHLRPPELRHVDVRNYHRFARGYLGSRGRMSRYAICGNDLRDTIIAQAIDNVRARRDGATLLKRPLELFSEEIRWINHHGIETEAEYVDAERIGRSRARLRRADRSVLFEVYEEYRELRASEYGRSYDWDDEPVERDDRQAPGGHRAVSVVDGRRGRPRPREEPGPRGRAADLLGVHCEDTTRRKPARRQLLGPAGYSRRSESVFPDATGRTRRPSRDRRAQGPVPISAKEEPGDGCDIRSKRLLPPRPPSQCCR
jgi:hypothetical protein